MKERGLITTPSHLILSPSDEFYNKTKRVNEMWQTDFTYFKIINWGWYYQSTVLDDYSRFIIQWECYSNMTTEDDNPSIPKALMKAGLTKNTAPRLLSDNGSCYIYSEIKAFLKNKGIKPLHVKLCHPKTQRKIERYHRTMKTVVILENYYSPEELTLAIR